MSALALAMVARSASRIFWALAYSPSSCLTTALATFFWASTASVSFLRSAVREAVSSPRRVSDEVTLADGRWRRFITLVVSLRGFIWMSASTAALVASRAEGGMSPMLPVPLTAMSFLNWALMLEIWPSSLVRVSSLVEYSSSRVLRSVWVFCHFLSSAFMAAVAFSNSALAAASWPSIIFWLVLAWAMLLRSSCFSISISLMTSLSGARSSVDVYWKNSSRTLRPEATPQRARRKRAVFMLDRKIVTR